MRGCAAGTAKEREAREPISADAPFSTIVRKRTGVSRVRAAKAGC